MMLSLNLNKGRAFTLIELLVVIAIIGVLASVVLASLNSTRAKARDTSRAAQIKEVKTALELYYHDNDAYIPGCESYLYQRTELLPYIGQLPIDPTYEGTNDEYRYCATMNGSAYEIRLTFEDKNRPGTDENGRCKTGVNTDEMPVEVWPVPDCEGI